MIKKFSEKVGLTPTEIKVIIFLIFVFLAGYGVKNFYLGEQTDYTEFDYSEEDSIFNSKTGLNKKISEKKLELDDKKVDYKQEVLDFNGLKFGNSEKSVPQNYSININTAGIEEFAVLPGIGKKTAEKIIIFRKKIGRFRKLNDLLKVKGIGNSKFTNIKKYIFIE